MWYMAPAREKKLVVWIDIELEDDPSLESEHECPCEKGEPICPTSFNTIITSIQFC
jgi:hypothetical protein